MMWPSPLTWLELCAFLLFAVPITLCDLRSLRIPDALTVSGIVVFFALNILLGRRALGVLCMDLSVGFGVFWLISRLTKGKMGLGDAKYSALIAVAAGTYAWLASVFVASVVALIVAVILIGVRKMDRRSRIPFAPFLTVGACVAFLLKGLPVAGPALSF